jgi:hypothetical protein
MLCSKIEFEKDTSNNKLLKIIWEQIKKIKQGERLGDFAHFGRLLKDYTLMIIKLKINLTIKVHSIILKNSTCFPCKII